MSTDDWCSPPEITERLLDFFHGPVDIDPCSNARSIVHARLALTHGGLVLPWELPQPVARTVYKNEPYSQSDAWTTKMLHELERERVREVVRLTMASTSTQWWENMCTFRMNPRILFLKRIQFLDPRPGRAGMKRQSCRFEPALIYFGPPKRHLAFMRTFASLARWVTWGRS